MAKDKILLVDDDPSIVELLQRFLNGQGYDVTIATSGAKALQAIQHEDYASAILDLRLPDISGLELLSHLKSHSPETEVILFTGHGGLDSALKALRLGAYDYLVKAELRWPDLQAVVERALERRRLARANRELLEHLRQAQEELTRRRAAELLQIRRIGEALARPLNCEELFQGLLNLVWEGLPLTVLCIKFQGQGLGLPWLACRHHDSMSRERSRRFQEWVEARLNRAIQEETGNSGDDGADSPPPVAAVLREKVRAGDVFGMVAAGREEPFTPEEAELFRIFSLQGEAALKNLLLFEEVKNLAIRDGLTGLYNHRHFWELLDREVETSRRYGKPLALIFLDIDDFKKINDTLGHPQGDVVLKHLAAYLQGEVRQSDFPCRYGGEEFVVLLHQTSARQAMVMAERLRARIADAPMPADNGELFLTVSIGVAGLTPGMDGADLVQAADAALLRAKQEGKNRVVGSEEASEMPEEC